MTQLLHGDRIGLGYPLRIGCSAAIFDPSGTKILLVRRAENGLWCLPAGGMEPGESVSEACEREVLEETGLVVQVRRIIGVYSTPHRIIAYPDGHRFQIVGLHFEAGLSGGDLQLSNETSDMGFFSMKEMDNLIIMEHCWERILDTFTSSPTPFIR